MVAGITVKAFKPFTISYATEIGGLKDTGAIQRLLETARHLLLRQGYDDGHGGVLNVDFDVFGRGFKYDHNIPYAGTVQEIKVSIDGQPAVYFHGTKVDATEFAKFFYKADPLVAFATLLVGDDFIQGSDLSDTIYGFKGKDKLFAWGGIDIVDGGRGDDINDGGPGNDFLKDTKGHDWFQFSSPLDPTNNFQFNYDTIKSFGRGDKIYLSTEYFQGIGMKLSAGEFVNGPAALDQNDHILWYNRVGYYDPDGNGPKPAIPFFTTQNDAHISYNSFVMGAEYDPY